MIVEDEDGEVIRKFEINSPQRTGDRTRQRVQRMSSWLGGAQVAEGEDGSAEQSSSTRARRESEVDPLDTGIHFKVEGSGRRMSTQQFIEHLSAMDPKSRVQVIEEDPIVEEDSSVGQSGCMEVPFEGER